MSKSLVITEKPSVARDIVAALGGFREHDGFWESDEMIVTFSVGHIVELLSPEDVIAREQLLDRADALAGARFLLELEALRQDRERVERPVLVFLIDFFGRQQLVEVAHREGDDVLGVLEEAVVFLEPPEHLHYVASDTRFLGDDERFGQDIFPVGYSGVRRSDGGQGPTGKISCPRARHRRH